jgi:hypothetical protein
MFVHVPEPEIYYPSGVELTLALSKPVYGKPLPESMEPAGRLAEQVRDPLEAILDNLPVRTRAQNSIRESDVINLMFIGSDDETARALLAAGWTEASAKSVRSRFLNLRAVVEGDGYRNAPMSLLLANDETPEMV